MARIAEVMVGARVSAEGDHRGVECSPSASRSWRLHPLRERSVHRNDGAHRRGHRL